MLYDLNISILQNIIKSFIFENIVYIWRENNKKN